MNKKITIYTSPSCTHCIHLKEWLQQNDQKYTEFNVTVDDEARDFIVKKSGQMGVPVILITDEQNSIEDLIIGFDQTKLSTSLDIKP